MSEKSEHIDSIIHKVLTGVASDHESEVLDTWLNESSKNHTTWQQIKDGWKERSQDALAPNHQEAFDEIWSAGTGNADKKSEVKSRSLTHYVMRVAASIALFVAVGFAFYFLMPADVGLSDIFSNEEKISWHEEVSRPGQRTRINMMDGSVIHLNSESKIRYSSQFGDSLRYIELEGEAFFEVAKNPDVPFIVQSGNLRTRALGTSFNINAWPGTDYQEVALVTGRVSVDEVNGALSRILEPGKVAIYQTRASGSKDLKVSQFSEQRQTAWKDGYLVFEGDDCAYVLEKIQRWYGVEVKTEGRMPDSWALHGRYKNPPLKGLLDNLKYSKGDFTYTLTAKELNIKFH